MSPEIKSPDREALAKGAGQHSSLQGGPDISRADTCPIAHHLNAPLLLYGLFEEYII